MSLWNSMITWKIRYKERQLPDNLLEEITDKINADAVEAINNN